MDSGHRQEPAVIRLTEILAAAALRHELSWREVNAALLILEEAVA